MSPSSNITGIERPLPIMIIKKIKCVKKYGQVSSRKYLNKPVPALVKAAAAIVNALCSVTFACVFLSVFFSFSTLASAANLLNLHAPERVTAGKSFVLSLSTGKEFPLLVNEDAAFFESCDGEEPRLAGICTLDAQGKASMELQRKKAGTCRYSVLVGPFQSEATVTVLPGPPAAIMAIQECLYLETGRRAAVEFAIEDLYGNNIATRCDAGDTGASNIDSIKGTNDTGGRNSTGSINSTGVIGSIDNTGNVGSTGNTSSRGSADHRLAEQEAKKLLAVVITDPEQHLLPAAEIGLVSNPAGNFVVRFLAGKKGDYLVEARLLQDAGISARSLVCVREPGTVTAIDLALPGGEKEPFLHISKDRTQPGRIELGAILRRENNLTKVPSAAEERNIIFSTDRPDLLKLEEITGGKALLTEKGKGGLATVTVTYLEEQKGLQKSIPLWISGEPAQIKLETQTSDLTAQVKATLLDEEGCPTREKTKNYRLDLPAGLRSTAQTEFARGQAEFVLEAQNYGSYTVGFSAGKGLHRDLKINFVEKIRPAKHAVLFIGQESYIRDGQPAKMKCAPEISYGRVFVPLEFLTATFGVEASIFPGKEKIALQGANGTTLVIDQEARELTVTNTKDGTTTATPISSLFLQKKAGTYFVPVGIIAPLLSVEVDYLPKRDQIEHVTFTRK